MALLTVVLPMAEEYSSREQVSLLGRKGISDIIIFTAQLIAPPAKLFCRARRIISLTQPHVTFGFVGDSDVIRSIESHQR